MNNILIVEDESIVAFELDLYISSLGFNTIGCCDNSDCVLKYIEYQNIDIIIMDIQIKGQLDGIELANIIKEKNCNIEIIFLTANLDDKNISNATYSNPIALLAKPFNQVELKAALKIAEHKLDKNRPKIKYPHNLIKLDKEFFYNKSSSILYYLKNPIILTKKEDELLRLFLKNLDTLIELETIAKEIWPNSNANANTVRTLVKRLREKLKNRFISTIQSRGYIMHLSV